MKEITIVVVLLIIFFWYTSRITLKGRLERVELKHEEYVKFRELIMQCHCDNDIEDEDPEHIYMYFYKGCLVATETIDHSGLITLNVKLSKFIFRPHLRVDEQLKTYDKHMIDERIKFIIKKNRNLIEKMIEVNRNYTKLILEKFSSNADFRSLLNS